MINKPSNNTVASPLLASAALLPNVLSGSSLIPEIASRSMSKSAPAPALPPTVSRQIPTTNGHAISIESTKRSASPIVNAIYPRRPSSSNSEHSPPRRKRSYQEALGDDDEDEDEDDDEASTSPRKQGQYSEDRKYMDDESSRHSGDNEEQRLASAALRRESEHSRRDSLSANGDDRLYPEYERTPAGALIDMDRKKRKRVFSNRTKTGCMTCRKRKKKCDEMHPECELSFPYLCFSFDVAGYHIPTPISLLPLPTACKSFQWRAGGHSVPTQRYFSLLPRVGFWAKLK